MSIMENHMAVPARNSRTRKEWADVINAGWRESLEGIINVGRMLNQAREELGRSDFVVMVEADLDFSLRSAENLMKIAGHPRIADASRGTNLLPRQWTVLRELARLTAEDFDWAESKGLISPEMSRGAATAIGRVKQVEEGGVIEVGRNPRDFPTPSEAREIARQTKRFVAASDGNVYSGASAEEEANHNHRRDRTYGVRDGIDTIADCDVSPAEWLKEADDHWLHDMTLASIDAAIDWLTALRPLLAQKQGVVDGE